jgi:hypothetical protein
MILHQELNAVVPRVLEIEIYCSDVKRSFRNVIWGTWGINISVLKDAEKSREPGA